MLGVREERKEETYMRLKGTKRVLTKLGLKALQEEMGPRLQLFMHRPIIHAFIHKHLSTYDILDANLGSGDLKKKIIEALFLRALQISPLDTNTKG